MHVDTTLAGLFDVKEYSLLEIDAQLNFSSKGCIHLDLDEDS